MKREESLARVDELTRSVDRLAAENARMARERETFINLIQDLEEELEVLRPLAGIWRKNHRSAKETVRSF